MSDWNRREQPSTEQSPRPDAPAPPRQLQLVVVAGPDAGKTLPLAGGARYRVGKLSDCDLVLADAQVSRTHLELEVGETAVVFRDLGSRNGSLFAGARFSELELGPGALVTVGATVLKLTALGELPTLPPSDAAEFGELLGPSLPMRQMFAVLQRVAASDMALLLEGETGTGKELCAAAVHQHSARRSGPFVICDLAGVARALIESELFGHVRGAFTGADRNRSGAFAAADGGTIFLDEIGELDLDLQPRLLRAIEQRAVKPVGATSYRQVDVRVIAATNRDLEAEVRAGRFRQDLYHRLSVVRVQVPPLRARKEDIVPLVRRLVGARAVELPAETIELLHGYDWPGNVRELRNVVERALSFAGDATRLGPELLGLTAPPAGAVGATALGATALDPVVSDPAASAGGEPFRALKERLVGAWERDYLARLLRATDGNVTEAARRSGIGRVYLHRLLKKHGLGGDDEP